MLFTSFNFIIFLAVVFLLYYLIPKKHQWKLLLAANYIFYALADASYLIYITATIITIYFAGIKIDKLTNMQKVYLSENKASLSKEEKKAYKSVVKKKSFRWLVICLLFNFLILAAVKYANFAIININWLLHMFDTESGLSLVNFVLPMGISFYTFQATSYIIDVYRGKHRAEKNIFKMALFVSFFPQLVQGPISRFSDLSGTLFNEHSFDKKVFLSGVQRIIWGFFKKLVIADRLLIAVKTLVSDPDAYNGGYTWLVMLFYAVTLYADFTGGIDITIGTAEALGIKLKENFNRPFYSVSIFDYWRRWHISMGTWFKDYLFYPLSVCKPMLRFNHFCRDKLGEKIGRKIPVYIITLTVWFTTGFWHGASWNFIMWGLANGIVIIISQECEGLYEKFHAKYKFSNTVYYKGFQILRTFWLMSMIRTFDCYPNVTTTFKMFGSLFTNFNYDVMFANLLNLGIGFADYIVVVLGVVLMIVAGHLHLKGGVRAFIAKRPVFVQQCVIFGLLLIIVVFGVYGIGYDSNQFIYNQF